VAINTITKLQALIPHFKSDTADKLSCLTLSCVVCWNNRHRQCASEQWRPVRSPSLTLHDPPPRASAFTRRQQLWINHKTRRQTASRAESTALSADDSARQASDETEAIAALAVAEGLPGHKPSGHRPLLTATQGSS